MSKEQIDYSRIKKAAIYPSIGVMRVGNSPEYFVGPLDTEPIVREAEFYRDDIGRLKRQAAEFRIYGLDENDNVVCELSRENDPEISIEWNAQLANQKSEWYGFTIALDIDEAKNYPSSFKRNLDFKDRSKLIIDGGLQALKRDFATKANNQIIRFDQGKIDGKEVYLGEMKFAAGHSRLHILGGMGVADNIVRAEDNQLIPPSTFSNNDNWYDDISDGPVTAKVQLKKGNKTVNIEVDPAWVVCGPPDYAPLQKSVRTMWDLMRDLHVEDYDKTIKNLTEKIKKTDQSIKDNQEILQTIDSDDKGTKLNFLLKRIENLQNTRTLLQKNLDRISEKRKQLYPELPSFQNDILPIFQRMTDLQWVNKGFDETFGYNKAYDFRNSETVAKLSDSSALNHTFRQNLYNEFRQIELPNNQGPSLWPWLYGDNMSIDFSDEKNQFTTLTKVQLTYLKSWVQGKFTDDYQGNTDTNPVSSKTTNSELFDKKIALKDQANMLSRAALDYCLADAFHPGCEMTWPVRQISMYMGEFRFLHATDSTILNHINYGESIDHTVVKNSDLDIFEGQVAGGISRWMAIPWQTDTASCRDGYNNEYSNFIPTFWPARVPNEILSYEQYLQIKSLKDTNIEQSEKAAYDIYTLRKEWLEDLPGNPNKLSPYQDVILSMVLSFDRTGIVTGQNLSMNTIPKNVQVSYIKNEKHLAAVIQKILIELLHIQIDTERLEKLILAIWKDDYNLIGNMVDYFTQALESEETAKILIQDLDKFVKDLMDKHPKIKKIITKTLNKLKDAARRLRDRFKPGFKTEQENAISNDVAETESLHTMSLQSEEILIKELLNHFESPARQITPKSLVREGEAYMTIAEKFREIYK